MHYSCYTVRSFETAVQLQRHNLKKRQVFVTATVCTSSSTFCICTEHLVLPVLVLPGGLVRRTKRAVQCRRCLVHKADWGLPRSNFRHESIVLVLPVLVLPASAGPTSQCWSYQPVLVLPASAGPTSQCWSYQPVLVLPASAGPTSQCWSYQPVLVLSVLVLPVLILLVLVFPVLVLPQLVLPVLGQDTTP